MMRDPPQQAIMRDLLEQAVVRGVLRPLDAHFALRLARWDPQADPHVIWAAALVSQRLETGDVCLDLEAWRDLPLFQDPVLRGQVQPPPVDAWVSRLRDSSLVEEPGGSAPLILDAPRLYLARYWQFEQDVIQGLRRHMEGWAAGVDRQRLKEALERIFPEAPGGGTSATTAGASAGPAGSSTTGRQVHEVDWQRVAAALAVLRNLCVISGGPGTGKTHTVAGILALLLELAGNDRLPRIALAAPTGKAAARLTESIRAEKSQGRFPPELARRIPEEAVTLHRLLGFRPGRAEPRHGRRDPLHLDVLVVDEASMVDLPLMARVLNALPEGARLILLGDRDQLSSVEAGMVLGDIAAGGGANVYSARTCAALEEVGALWERTPGTGRGPAAAPDGKPFGPRPARQSAGRGTSGLSPGKGAARRSPGSPVNQRPAQSAAPGSPGATGGAASQQPPIADHVVVLRRNWRFGAGSGIGALAQAVNQGDADRVLEVLRDPALPDVTVSSPGLQSLDSLIQERIVPVFQEVARASDPARALDLLNRVRLLAAVREGPYGVAGLNARVYGALTAAGVIERPGEHYHGRPVMVTVNDHGQHLYNGDVGVEVSAPGGTGLRAWFPDESGVRRVLPARLPRHATVYATTVHKSQGSEFEEVVLVLPPVEVRVLTRELLYTAVTRARARVTLLAGEEILRYMVQQQVSRSSGLRAALQAPV